MSIRLPETKNPASSPGTASALGGQSAFFLAGNVFTLAVGLPLQIYVARVLGASDLGVFSLLEGGAGLVAAFIGFGIAPTLVRFIPAYIENGKFAHVRSLLSWGALILLIVGCSAAALAIGMLPIIEAQWPALGDNRVAAIVMLTMIPLGLMLFFVQQGLRGFHEIRHMVVGSSFLQLTVKLTATVLFFALGYQLLGYVMAVFISVSVAVLWMTFGLVRRIRVLPDLGMTSEDKLVAKSEWRRYASIMYGNSLLGLSAYLDRFVIGFFAGAGPVGVLAVVKQLQQLPVVFLQMFITVVAPMFSAAHAKHDREQIQHLYVLTTDWVVRASLPLFLFFLIFAQPLLGLYGTEFMELGVLPLWILVSTQIVNLAFGPVGNLLNMCGQESGMLKITLYQSVLTIVLLTLLVPSFGLTGGAIALGMSVLFNNVAAMFLARHRLKLRWWSVRYRKWTMPLVASILFGVGINFWSADPGAVALILCLIGLYVVFHCVSWLQGLHDDDLELLGYLRTKLWPVSPS